MLSELHGGWTIFAESRGESAVLRRSPSRVEAFEEHLRSALTEADEVRASADSAIATVVVWGSYDAVFAATVAHETVRRLRSLGLELAWDISWNRDDEPEYADLVSAGAGRAGELMWLEVLLRLDSSSSRGALADTLAARGWLIRFSADVTLVATTDATSSVSAACSSLLDREWQSGGTVARVRLLCVGGVGRPSARLGLDDLALLDEVGADFVLAVIP